jgi:hypothetical protein
MIGPRTVPPGETTQFAVRGVFSDGSTQDLTGQASWQSQSRTVLSVDSRGRASGGERGATLLTAVAAGRSVSTEVLVLPAGTFRVSVVVNEDSALALDVRVEVVSGVGAGLVDVTPVNGRYDLYGVAGDAEIRISGNGYRDQVQRVVVTDHTALTVQVVSSRARVDVSGSYVLTIEGDAGCRAALPPGLASRRYGAVVSQAGAEVRVLLSGADFALHGLNRNGFIGRIDGRSENIVFNLGGFSDTFYAYAYSQPDVIENMGDSIYLYFAGGAVTSVSPTRLSGFFNGVIRQIKFHSYGYASLLFGCSSNRITFTLSR